MEISTTKTSIALVGKGAYIYEKSDGSASFTHIGEDCESSFYISGFNIVRINRNQFLNKCRAVFDFALWVFFDIGMNVLYKKKKIDENDNTFYE
jgi:hypothetical protein